MKNLSLYLFIVKFISQKKIYEFEKKNFNVHRKKFSRLVDKNFN